MMLQNEDTRYPDENAPDTLKQCTSLALSTTREVAVYYHISDLATTDAPQMCKVNFD